MQLDMVDYDKVRKFEYQGGNLSRSSNVTRKQRLELTRSEGWEVWLIITMTPYVVSQVVLQFFTQRIVQINPVNI